ncbi:MAG: SulP family inorganic anion transporter, partial [Actinomycetota bacterium]
HDPLRIESPRTMGSIGGALSEQRRSQSWPVVIAAGLIIGAVEVVLAVAFAALVFGGLLVRHLPDAIGLYLAAAALTLAILAWRAGSRGVIGSVQDAAAAVLAVVAAAAAAKAAALSRTATAAGLQHFEAPDIFLTVVAATLVVTVLCGVVFLVFGMRRWGNVIRFVPYPVVGGFLAGTGWLLFKGGIHVSSAASPYFTPIADLIEPRALRLGLPAFAFGVILLLAVRIVKRPLVIPAVIGIGLVLFMIGVLVTGSSIETVRRGGWLLGPFETARLWQPWAFRALGGADWSAVLESWAGIATAVFVAAIAILFNISGTELILDRDLDTNEELRDAGFLNVISGALGGIPGYHALSLTALGERMNVNARSAGLVAALVPLAAVVFGASVIELIPRMIVGGVLVYLGLSFMVEWVWDKRRSLPPVEYGVVIVILAVIIARGFLPGVVVGLVLAVVLFAVNYGRVELVREVAFGDTYHSNVDRPPEERAELRTLADRVQVLRVSGFVFFGSTNGLLERIRRRVEAGPLRFLVIDLRRVSGVDSSAVVAFVKAMRLAEANGFEIVLTGASDPVRRQLERGGVAETDAVLRFEPDLDRGLQRCEDALLTAAGATASGDDDPLAGLEGLPPGLAPYLERVSLPEGTVLLHQDDPPGDVFVLASGRLGVQTVTPEGNTIRLRSVRPGVVVGEIALYTGVARTADVVAETPSVVLRFSRASIERMEAEEPEVAAALHRWLAGTLAERLTETMRAADTLLS